MPSITIPLHLPGPPGQFGGRYFEPTFSGRSFAASWLKPKQLMERARLAGLMMAANPKGFRTPSSKSNVLDLSYLETCLLAAGHLKVPRMEDLLSKESKRKREARAAHREALRADPTRGMTAAGARDYVHALRLSRETGKSPPDPAAYRGLDYHRRTRAPA